MSLYATITWGIVTAFLILEVVDLITDYIKKELTMRRIDRIVNRLEDAWDDIELDLAPVRKKTAVKKVAKRK